MTNDERNTELYKRHGASAEKYVYYLVALTVAAIAYSIDITKDDRLSIETIFILLAIISWGFSFFFGSRYIIESIKLIKMNMEHFTKKPEEKAAHYELLVAKSNKTGDFNTRQLWSFGIGIVFFVMWYVFHLYNNSLTCPYYN